MRKLMLLVTTLALLLSFGAAYAQDDMMMGDHEEFCGDLSEEDCDLYYDLQEGVVPDSTLFDLVIDTSITVDGAPFDIGIEASGGYVYDVTIVQDYMDSISEIPLLEVDTEVFVGFLEAGITAFDAELFLTVDLPGMAAMMLPTTTIEADLWLVDGIAYADLTPIGELAEDPSIAGVYGIDAFELIRIALSEVTLGDVFEGIEDGGMDVDDFGGDFQQNFMAGQISDPDDIGTFATFTRLENGEVDGVETAVFETVIDVPALFEIDEIRDAVAANIPEEADIDPDALIDALIEGLDSSVITVVEEYGIEDGYLYNSELVVAFTIDPAAFEDLEDESMGEMLEDAMEATEEPMEAMPEPIEFSLEMTFTRSDVNAVGEIVLPEDAEIVPSEALLQMGAGM